MKSPIQFAHRYGILAAGLIILLVTAGCQFAGKLAGADAPVPTLAAEIVTLQPAGAQSSTAAPEGAAVSQPSPEAAPEGDSDPTASPAEAPTEPAAPPAGPSPEAESETEPPPTASPEPEPAPGGSYQDAACAEEICVHPGTFLLSHPIGPEGRRTIDYSNRFGEYRRSTDEGHHGVDFLNSSGTPVLAAAAGTVVVAGDDSQTIYARYPNTYGSLVILEHELPGISGPVYTLYGHLSQVSVRAGDAVQGGQEIGLVGMTGSVSGSTLHFEVRFGENAYGAVRNPELWLAPLDDDGGRPLGALAGWVQDAKGNYLAVSNILIERLAGPGQPAIDQYYLKTYSEKRLVGSAPWQENFALASLPAGEYQISFMHQGLQQKIIEIEPGKLTFVKFQIE